MNVSPGSPNYYHHSPQHYQPSPYYQHQQQQQQIYQYPQTQSQAQSQFQSQTQSQSQLLQHQPQSQPQPQPQSQSHIQSQTLLTSTPQHFHHPSAINTFNQSNTTSSSVSTFKPNTVLTGNAVPRPYQSYNPSTTSGGVGGGISSNLEACVKDLHDKTFGPGGVVQITSNFSKTNQQPGKNYEGYTSRYETRSYEKNEDTKPLETNFAQLSLQTDNGKVNLVEEGSSRLSSMTQRVLERKTMTTTMESRMEKKSEQHSFRLE